MSMMLPPAPPGGGAPPPAGMQDLMAALQGGQGGQGGPGGGQGPDPLQTLQDVIQLLPGLMAVLPDPRDTQDVAQALLIMTRIQSRLMAGAAGGPQAA
jgi:hypothetical protein